MPRGTEDTVAGMPGKAYFYLRAKTTADKMVRARPV